MTEGVPVTNLNGEMYENALPGSVGIPSFGTTIRIVDEMDHEVPEKETGEIVVHIPHMFIGYYNRPEETAEALRNDWFHTGDVGYLYIDGYFFIVNSIKQMIKRKEYSVYPAEVERVLQNPPAVREVAAVGIEDEISGEEVKVYVVLKTGSSASAEELIEDSKSQLAP